MFSASIRSFPSPAGLQSLPDADEKQSSVESRGPMFDRRLCLFRRTNHDGIPSAQFRGSGPAHGICPFNPQDLAGTTIRPHPMIQIYCAALLFDMDGVLINSTPAVARVWRHWAVEHGFNPEEVVARAHGRPSLATVREYLPNADHEAENREVERREIEDLEGVVALPGALELLASLPGDRWTIVTSCTRPLAEVRIQAAGLPLPKRLITSNDITHGKPHPEPYLKGAAELGFPPAECIVVEDVPAGVRAGKGAGAKVIAFKTTVQESVLRDAGPDWILNNCSDIRVVNVGKSLTLGVCRE
jgi:sugar-phosphatase